MQIRATASMKNAIIVTVFNEDKTVGELIDSILIQTKTPDEVVIVDGGSKDQTVSSIRYRVSGIKTPKFKVFVKKGNRSVGRNEAIRRCGADIIVITDAGCILDKNWFKNITKPLLEKNVDVVAGYYKAKSESVFQKCLAPYVLVMPDRVDSSNFLPATRSMAIRKSVWKKVGGFNEKLSNNEDYEFARRISNKGFDIKFERNAFVSWIPRTNLFQAFNMFYRFALGDSESGIIRPKVILVFVRYIVGIYLLFINYYLLLILVVGYVLWSILKNYKYAKDNRAIVILPILQVTADFAVMLGTIRGFSRL